MSEEKKLHLHMDEVAVPEVLVEGAGNPNEQNEREQKAILEQLEGLGTEDIPDEELETVVDYSGAFPEVRIVRKEKKENR